MGCMQLKPLDKGIIKSNLVTNNENNKKNNEDVSKMNNLSNHKQTLSKSSFTNQDRQISTPYEMGKRGSLNYMLPPRHFLDLNEEKKVLLPNSSQNLIKSHVLPKIKANLQPTGLISKIENFEIGEIDKIQIKQALSNHFLFKDKTTQIISLLLDNLELIKLY